MIAKNIRCSTAAIMGLAIAGARNPTLIKAGPDPPRPHKSRKLRGFA